MNKVRAELTTNNIAELEGMLPFQAILDEYQKERVQSGSSGRVFVPELNRFVEYVLPIKKQAQEMLRLVVAPHVKAKLNKTSKALS